MRGSVGLVATLALAMGAGPVLVHGLTAMSPLVVADLGLTRTQFGSLATLTFLVAGLSSGLAGALVDRISERRTMVLLFVGSALTIWAAAAAPGYLWLVLAVVLSGAVQAVSNPVTNRVVSWVDDPGRRGTVLGVKQAGVQMAQASAGLVLPALALAVGWRWSLATATAVSLAGLVLVVRHVRTPGRAAAEHATARRPRVRLPAAVWWLAAFAFLSGCALQATNVYLPLYGYQAVGLAGAAAGALTAVVGGVGLVARILWGRMVGRVPAPRAPLLVLVAGSLLGLGLILLAETAGAALLWVGTAVFAATGIAANVVLMVTVIRVVPPALVGRATGALATGLYLGFAVGPVTFGRVVDTTGDYRVGWLGAVAMFAVGGVLVLLRRDWTPRQR